MIRYSLIFCLFLFTFFSISSCKKDNEPASLSLQITPLFGADPFALNTIYTLSNNQRLRISRVEFYLSDIYATRANGERVLIKKVALCNLSEPVSCAIPAELSGDFTGIEMTLGLTPELNNTDPMAVSSTDPLSESQNMHWAWLKYIFFKLEGFADISGTGTGNLTQSLSYHVGADPQAVFKSFPRSFSVQSDNPSSLTLQLDLKRLFDQNPDALNMVSENQTDTDNRPDVAARFANLFGQSFLLP